MTKLIAFDLDGTLTQHKTLLEPENRAALNELSKKYSLVMVGAGGCMRIFRQLGEFPIDIVGNYGMQVGIYDNNTRTLNISEKRVDCDRDSIEAKVTALRERFGFTSYTGDNVQYHPSGCVTIPLLGTEASIVDKLEFDPDRTKRRAIYEEVCAMFPDYNVFVGGSSSFDMSPRPYDKLYALTEYATQKGYKSDEIVYVGDDYGHGGNDEAVYLSDVRFIKIDDYRSFPNVMASEGLL